MNFQGSWIQPLGPMSGAFALSYSLCMPLNNVKYTNEFKKLKFKQLADVVTWLQSSQSSRKFENIQDQLDFHDKLAIVLHQIQTNQIGIHGKCFTVTYSFVGNMTSLIFTYAIILFQLS
ncbi:unnamed protein product [Allacma fusca]|uniref:Uncharacterized protein n=1 Tax=Allacma fusca TaxID=39272 RepID=A0A8J2P8K0_9HEXA|nr:unnamed protein product [Allacma fusca]